jgi:hypothetical protein
MVQELHNPVYIALPPRLIELRREFDTEVPYVRLGTPASLMPGSEKYVQVQITRGSALSSFMAMTMTGSWMLRCLIYPLAHTSATAMPATPPLPPPPKGFFDDHYPNSEIIRKQQAFLKEYNRRRFVNPNPPKPQLPNTTNATTTSASASTSTLPGNKTTTQSSTSVRRIASFGT